MVTWYVGYSEDGDESGPSGECFFDGLIYEQHGEAPDEHDRIVAEMVETIEDARLIAAAPTLLSAAQAVVPVLAGIAGAYGPGPARDVLQAMHDELAAAVRQATEGA